MRYAIDGVVELYDGQNGQFIGYGERRLAYYPVSGTGEGWYDSAMSRSARYFRPAIVADRAAAIELALRWNAGVTVLEDMR